MYGIDVLIQSALAHRWLGLAIVIIGWLTRIVSSDSAFPVTIPTRWKPVLVIILGQAYGALTLILGGASWQSAVIDGLMVAFCTMGLFDLVIKAIFNGNEPRWIKILALVFPTSGLSN